MQATRVWSLMRDVGERTMMAEAGIKLIHFWGSGDVECIVLLCR